MELYLQHFFFFFRSHNFKKPYITSFNRKKALIEKEDTRNMVILTLLPKIDILRLTKRHHQKELRSLWLAYCISLLGQRKWKASARPLHTSRPRFPLRAQVAPENPYSLRIGTKILRVILPSQHPLKVRTESKQAKKVFFLKKKIP